VSNVNRPWADQQWLSQLLSAGMSVVKAATWSEGHQECASEQTEFRAQLNPCQIAHDRDDLLLQWL